MVEEEKTGKRRKTFNIMSKSCLFALVTEKNVKVELTNYSLVFLLYYNDDDDDDDTKDNSKKRRRECHHIENNNNNDNKFIIKICTNARVIIDFRLNCLLSIDLHLLDFICLLLNNSKTKQKFLFNDNVNKKMCKY